MKLFFPFSFNVVFWCIVGVVRYYFENIVAKNVRFSEKKYLSERSKVAICIPAHNEEKIIEDAINQAKKIVPENQLYVVSDGSTDNTTQILLKFKCNVLTLLKSAGKAKALTELLGKFQILNKFDYVLFLDADTRLDENYLRKALKFMYLNPEISVLAAHANPAWRKKIEFSFADFISSYRTRLYKVLQITFMYGMTWKYLNVNPVIPGFAAMYRTPVLKELELDTQGIWIEDFNMAFQIHNKNLGKIGYKPEISATYQDPSTLEDYWNQLRRWNVGFFQTVRKHGLGFSLFSLSLVIFMAELIFFSIFILAIPIPLVILLLINSNLLPAEILENNILTFVFPQGYAFAIEVLVSLLIFDYILTLIIAIAEKKYRMIIYGLFFVFFQILNSLILISSIKTGFFGTSDGKWAHAKRD